MISRDELAARNMAALLSNPSGPVQANPSSGWGLTNCTPDDVAALAVSLTDALIARLRPATVAPVADAAPRPEWVRLSGDFRLPLERKVVRWEGHQPVVMHSSGLSELAPLVGGEWEPCAAPAPSPAAAPDHPSEARRGQGAEGDQHPAAYVPKVGDRVMHAGPDDGRRFVVTAVDAFAVIRVDSKRSAFCVSGPWIDNAAPVYDGPATAAERAAAGLPPITPDHPQGGHDEAEGRVGDQRVAAGLDAPAFDESSERETAVDIAKDRGLDVAEEVGFVAGWLARARIAAKGGAS